MEEEEEEEEEVEGEEGEEEEGGPVGVALGAVDEHAIVGVEDLLDDQLEELLGEAALVDPLQRGGEEAEETRGGDEEEMRRRSGYVKKQRRGREVISII